VEVKTIMVYVVLGMHKSGTTLVARMLHESGIIMGGEGDCSGDYDSIVPGVGFYENSEIKAVNHLILKRGLVLPMLRNWFLRLWRGIDRRPSSLSLVLRVPTELNEIERLQMHQIINRYQNRHRNWGFKDPRVCLTYHLWAKELPPHQLIVVFRGYQELLRRYNVHAIGRLDVMKVYVLLHAWSYYNAAIRRALDLTEHPFIVLRYEDLMSDSGKEFERLAEFVNTPLVDCRDYTKYRNRAKGARNELGMLINFMAPFLPQHPHVLLAELQELTKLKAGL
jgi:hypothetical protein